MTTASQIKYQKEHGLIPRDVFDQAFANAKPIEFNPNWKNGTGYFDHAVTDNLGLANGELAGCVDDKNRKLIIVGTPVANVVVFERHDPKRDLHESDKEIFAFNMPHELYMLMEALMYQPLDWYMLRTLLGNPVPHPHWNQTIPNIGERLADVFERATSG